MISFYFFLNEQFLDNNFLILQIIFLSIDQEFILKKSVPPLFITKVGENYIISFKWVERDAAAYALGQWVMNYEFKHENLISLGISYTCTF